MLTPGFDRATGGYADHGIPAPVVAQYLRENRIVPEKNDLNSLLFLLTPGVEASKAGTLISGLVAFKKLHDDKRCWKRSSRNSSSAGRPAMPACGCAISAPTCIDSSATPT